MPTPVPAPIWSDQAKADARLGRVLDQLLSRYDVPLPEMPAPIPGANPAWARVQQTTAAAIRLEAIVDHLRRPPLAT